MKPYLRLAYGLMLFGISLFMLERYGLDAMRGAGQPELHLPGALWTAMVLAPVVLVCAGCIVFMYGKIRRL